MLSLDPEGTREIREICKSFKESVEVFNDVQEGFEVASQMHEIRSLFQQTKTFEFFPSALTLHGLSAIIMSGVSSDNCQIMYQTIVHCSDSPEDPRRSPLRDRGAHPRPQDAPGSQCSRTDGSTVLLVR